MASIKGKSLCLMQKIIVKVIKLENYSFLHVTIIIMHINHFGVIKYLFIVKHTYNRHVQVTHSIVLIIFQHF